MPSSMSEQSRPSTAASSDAQTATSHRSLSHVVSDKVESLTLKKSPTQAKWSGSSKPVLPRDLAWYMPLYASTFLVYRII